MSEENHLTKRYGKTVAVDQPVPLAKRPRAFTWARIVALLVTIVLLTGLTYLRVSSSPETVSVPQGAHAGQLTMHPCTYPTENGAYRADCGTLVVPENRADPRSRLIALPVTRVPGGRQSPSRR
jgi:hypothetical protein